MPYFKYLKNRRKLNNFRKKLAITPFFSEFNERQGETSYQLGLHSSIEKIGKNVYKNIFFLQKIHKKTYFSPISSEI